MNRTEFESKLGKKVDDNHWDVIEHVYVWHPSFDRLDAKKVSVELYKLLGITPFLAMYSSAKEAEDLDIALKLAEASVEEINRKIEDFRKQIKG